MSKIIIGAQHQQRLTYRNTDGVLTNPDSLVGLMRRYGDTAGGGTVTLTEDTTGIWDVIVTPDAVGMWWVEVTATGTGTFVDRVDEYSVCVTDSSVA